MQEFETLLDKYGRHEIGEFSDFGCVYDIKSRLGERLDILDMGSPEGSANYTRTHSNELTQVITEIVDETALGAYYNEKTDRRSRILQHYLARLLTSQSSDVCIAAVWPCPWSILEWQPSQPNMPARPTSQPIQASQCTRPSHPAR